MKQLASRFHSWYTIVKELLWEREGKFMKDILIRLFSKLLYVLLESLKVIIKFILIPAIFLTILRNTNSQQHRSFNGRACESVWGKDMAAERQSWLAIARKGYVLWVNILACENVVLAGLGFGQHTEQEYARWPAVRSSRTLAKNNNTSVCRTVLSLQKGNYENFGNRQKWTRTGADNATKSKNPAKRKAGRGCLSAAVYHPSEIQNRVCTSKDAPRRRYRITAYRICHPDRKRTGIG